MEYEVSVETECHCKKPTFYGSVTSDKISFTVNGSHCYIRTNSYSVCIRDYTKKQDYFVK